jgi:hypothetical protein
MLKRLRKKNSSKSSESPPVTKIPSRIAPPNDFDPMTAANTDLVKYGYPPRPDKESTPHLRSLWERKVSSSPRFVSPSGQNIRHLFKKASSPQGIHQLNTVTSGFWSGALIDKPPTGQTFYTISASWTIPMAGIPPASAYSTGVVPDGVYASIQWVGMDGQVAALDPGLSAGTISFCQVVGGRVAPDTQYAQAWYQWGGDETYAGIDVSPGDLVTITVCGAAGNKEGLVTLLNATENTTSGAITVPAPTNVVVVGDNVAWSLGVVSTDGAAFANYGATFFYDCLAASRNPDGSNVQEHNLTSADILNLVNPPAKSTAVQLAPEVLMLYAYNNGP